MNTKIQIFAGTTAFPMDSGDLILAGIRREGSSGQQRILMKNVIIHPQYNPVNEDTDIAIVKLKSPLSFNNNVKNACLPGSSFAPQSNNAVVSGWGWTIPGMFVFYIESIIWLSNLKISYLFLMYQNLFINFLLNVMTMAFTSQTSKSPS